MPFLARRSRAVESVPAIGDRPDRARINRMNDSAQELCVAIEQRNVNIHSA